ncbi:MAG: hypothetical protein AAFN27_21250 [Pseudomonadota bacterium]
MSHARKAHLKTLLRNAVKRGFVSDASNTPGAQYRHLHQDTMYRLEATDPKHRYGEELIDHYNEWSRLPEADEGNQSFWQWLAITHPHDAPTEVRYLDRTERRQYLVHLQEKPAYVAPRRPVPDGQHMFVMAPDGQVYIAPKEQGRLHHSSFMAGHKVRTAGMITISGGAPWSLSNQSGHYRPPLPSLCHMINALKRAGADLDLLSVSVDGMAVMRAADFLAQYDAAAAAHPAGAINQPQAQIAGAQVAQFALSGALSGGATGPKAVKDEVAELLAGLGIE